MKTLTRISDTLFLDLSEITGIHFSTIRGDDYRGYVHLRGGGRVCVNLAEVKRLRGLLVISRCLVAEPCGRVCTQEKR